MILPPSGSQGRWRLRSGRSRVANCVKSSKADSRPTRFSRSDMGPGGAVAIFSSSSSAAFPLISDPLFADFVPQIIRDTFKEVCPFEIAIALCHMGKRTIEAGIVEGHHIDVGRSLKDPFTSLAKVQGGKFELKRRAAGVVGNWLGDWLGEWACTTRYGRIIE